MSEGQTKRRIGQGMKPRDKQAEAKKEEVVESDTMSTVEGQQESIIEPILARQEGELSGDHLEPETVQNLDSPETAGVAQSDPLAEALAESGTVPEYESVPEYEYEDNCYGTGAGKVSTKLTPAEMDATAAKVADQFVRELSLEEMEAITPAVSNWTPAPMRVELQGPGGRTIEMPSFGLRIDVDAKESRIIHALGLQPDGSYKIVTTIPEGYLQAVKDWAESDGVTLEEWVDRQLSGYLENWGSPAKGR